MSLPALSASPSAHRLPHRVKKSKTELPPPPPIKTTAARFTHSLTSPSTATSRPVDIDRLDEQLSAVTLRDSSVLTLCDTLAQEADSATKERRLALVRGIRDKLIGSESNKALCVHFKHHCTLISLLAQSLDADEADGAELRLQLLTALSSLATGGKHAQQQLQHDGLMDVLFECVQSGQQPLVDAAIVALRPLLLSASMASAQDSSAAAAAFSHVDFVLHLICCFRHWQTHTSDAAAASLTAMASGSLTQQLCLIQHGLIPVLMSHLTTYKPSLPSQPVSAPFVASLRLLSALCHHNIYLVSSLSLPASHSQSLASLQSTSCAAATSSLFPFAASLLLHPHVDIRLHTASLIVRSALVHVRLQRSKRYELEAEERLIRDSELLRLHREWAASPVGKRGRAGNVKGGHKRQPVPLAADAFSLQQWMGALQPLLVSCTVSSTSPFASAVTVLSPLLTRVLQVLVRLVESDVSEVAVEAVEALCEVLDGWDCGYDELGDQLLSLTLARLLCYSPTSLSSRILPDVRPPLLRLLSVLCQQERYRRTVLSHSMYWSSLIDLCDSLSQEVQCAAMHIMGQLVLSCRVQQAFARSHAASKLQPFIALLLSRMATVEGDDAHVSEAATYAISCLLRPHAFRPLVADTGRDELLAKLIRWTKDDEADKTSNVNEQGVSILWQRAAPRRQRRIYALTAIANLVFRCDKDMQKRAIDGVGGWPQLLAMLQARKQSDRQAADDELLCGVLAVIQQLVGAALRHETDDEMYDWVAATQQPEAKRDTSEPLLTADHLSALLTTLAPMLSSLSSSAVLSSLLAVLVNVSSHPRASAALLMSAPAHSMAVLQLTLQGLRTSQVEQRELAVLVLYNALLLVVDERQRKCNGSADSAELPMNRSTSSSSSSSGRSRATFGKRRRSMSRSIDDAQSTRRTRRRADGNGHNDSSQRSGRRDSDDTDEADTDAAAGSDQKDDEQPEVTYLVRLSTAGVIAELLRLDETEVDGAVLGRVRRVLLLLRMIAAVSTSHSNQQLLMQLRALEVDVEEEAERQLAEGDADEEEDEQAREMEDVRLRLTDDEMKVSDQGSVRVRWRSTMSGSRLGREEWMVRHRALTRVREAAELEEQRSMGTQQQQHGDDGDEKQYESHSGGSGEEEVQEREGHAESRLLRHYVREWMTQPLAPRPNDIDSVFGRFFAPYHSPSLSSASSSSSSSSAASSSALSAASLRHPAQSPYPLHGVLSLSSALDRRSRHMRAMASAMGVRLADQQRSAQGSSRRGEARR